MDNSRRNWLALTRVKGLDRRSLSALIALFGGPGEVFEGLVGAAPEGVSEKAAEAVRRFEGWSWVDEELERAGKAGVEVLTLDDPGYPALLREIYDPPYVLYARGGAGVLDSGPAIAVVGTRYPSHYGSSMAEGVSRDLAAMGAVVVSGLARGCDTAAHRGALSAGGATVAVLGTGVDVVYPRENGAVYDEIASTGLVLSELPMGTGPAPYNFPKRNRIISGVSEAVLVVEAPERSGALMTARLALDSGREVFAVPGQATSHRSRGTNRLIKDGALLVENAADIAMALSFEDRLGPADGPAGGGEDRPGVAKGDSGAIIDVGRGARLVLDCLDSGPLDIDAIAERTGLPVVKASAVLLDMELKGYVVKTPGMRFARRS